MSLADLVPDARSLTERLAEVGYLADSGLATALFCAVRLPQPLLLEGEAGVGKTQAAKALAELLDTPLIRLQCFEGIDSSEALYEWNYPRQLLGIRLAEARGADLAEETLFGPDYLIRRPLLAALEHPGPQPGRPAHRRDRPRRRGVRGVPLRAARRGERHDPGDRHAVRGAQTDRRAHLEPHS